MLCKGLLTFVWFFVAVSGEGTDAAPKPKGPWYFKCLNAECHHELKVDDFDEYRKMLPPFDPDDVAGITVMKCPKCGTKKLYPAEFCPRCKKIYVPSININPFHPTSNDICPTKGCDYSPSAERAKRWREKHGRGN